jgi:hypothetical protein
MCDPAHRPRRTTGCWTLEPANRPASNLTTMIKCTGCERPFQQSDLVWVMLMGKTSDGMNPFRVGGIQLIVTPQGPLSLAYCPACFDALRQKNPIITQDEYPGHE